MVYTERPYRTGSSSTQIRAKPHGFIWHEQQADVPVWIGIRWHPELQQSPQDAEQTLRAHAHDAYLGLQAERRRARARAACRLYKTFHIARKIACSGKKYGCSHNVPCCLNWRRSLRVTEKSVSFFKVHFCKNVNVIFLYQDISTFEVSLTKVMNMLAFKIQQLTFQNKCNKRFCIYFYLNVYTCESASLTLL